ncbi:MAG: DUF1826 domain-containing protein [Candidatus Competibacteraceae bacterium]|nr:MAG: DUF1826 domain-containing protein [Candidatus Competibacteraceae bacterium]
MDPIQKELHPYLAAAIALLKGEAWPGNAGHGLIHRSPAVPAGEGPRVLVAIDAR